MVPSLCETAVNEKVRSSPPMRKWPAPVALGPELPPAEKLGLPAGGRRGTLVGVFSQAIRNERAAITGNTWTFMGGSSRVRDRDRRLAAGGTPEDQTMNARYCVPRQRIIESRDMVVPSEGSEYPCERTRGQDGALAD